MNIRAHLAAIEADRLTKHYGDSLAVDGISFAIETGSITGLLGGNGAGKTTTIGMMMGLIAPTSRFGCLAPIWRRSPIARCTG